MKIKSPDAIALLTCAVAAILLLPLRNICDAFPPFAFVATLVLFMAPGFLVSHWLLGDDLSGFAHIPVGFAISTGVFGILGVPALILHLSTGAYLLAAGIVLCVFLAVAAWRVKSRGVEPPVKDTSYGSSAGWLWAPFWLLSGVLAFVGLRRVPNSYDDAWVYLSWVRDFSYSNRLALRDPYFGEKVAEFSRVKVNGWLLEQAALSRVSGLDTIELVLRYLTPALVVVALLMVYALARILLKSERAAVLTATVYALFHVVFIQPSVQNIGVELAARISEDKYAARFMILPATLLFAVLFIENRRWRYLGLFTFFCWAAVAVHPSVLPAVGLCMLGLGAAHVAVNRRRKRAWTGMVALALGMWSVVLGPALLMFVGGSPSAVLFSADINATPPKVLEYTVFITESWRHIYGLGEGLYIMHPWLLFNPVILGAYLFGVPFLLWRVRKSVAAQLLLGGLIVVTAAVYVPQIATFIGNNLIVPGLLWRLAWPIPLLALVATGWMLWEALGYAGSRLGEIGMGRGAIKALPLALVALLTAAAAPPSVERAVGLYRKYDIARTSDYDPDPIFPWIADHIREPGVLLARDSANNVIPAYSTALNVVSQRGEGMIRDREQLEKLAGSRIDIPQRYLDVHDFFFGPTLDREAYAILRRYHADYLMVYRDSPLDERLKILPGFSPIKGAPRVKYSLYKVDLENLGRPASGPDRPQETAPPAPEPSTQSVDHKPLRVPQDPIRNSIIQAVSSMDPRLSAALLAARSARFASRTLKIGGGSTVPGVVARRVDPKVLTKLTRRLPLASAAITGTNGKTTTTRMVSKILRAAGIAAVNNSTGANLVTGVTAALVADSRLAGTPRSEMGLFEVDEASIPRVAAEAEIKVLAVLNLFRDQLDRYGELAYTGKVVSSAFGDLPQNGSVVLNADDPLVASLGRSARSPVFYGVDEPALDTGRLQHVADSKDCPVCGTALDYETVYMGHVGVYDCPRCDFSRPEPDYRASGVRLEGAGGSEFLLSTPNGETVVKVGLPGLYNVYNALAAAAVAGEAGAGLPEISRGLGEFGGAFGRVERVEAGDREAFLLLIKNPVGFNEILRTFVTSSDAENVLIAINDNDADGRDVSWLWDVDFEMLADARSEGKTNAAPFTVSGIRAEDMAVRLKYADLPVGPVIPDREKAIKSALQATPPGETLYVLPTYTAMLEIRKTLSEMGYTHPFWEE